MMDGVDNEKERGKDEGEKKEMEKVSERWMGKGEGCTC